eukprot:CAMPEP_0173215544 /NCGR_PEP_ID=MMETSP1141-20130122/26553_1 /TAXON_ID=483371 /ORGANISM="non described non described, Strain CCMP2298" /LENGTH=58 /DNA_ID=CAMNT_0014142963 /DNA_START=203 /DNA_END=375 /DNA_ORIENTATION=-
METLEVGAEPSQQAQVPSIQRSTPSEQRIVKKLERLQILACVQEAPQQARAAQGVAWR